MRQTPGMSGTAIGSEYSDEEREFMMAMDRWKRVHNRPFPLWSEVLAVLKSLGWRKVTEPDSPAQLPEVE